MIYDLYQCCYSENNNNNIIVFTVDSLDCDAIENRGRLVSETDLEGGL